MAETDKTPQQQEVETLTKKAEHLSDFGTLTSLISTAAYFIENTVVKKLPKWVSVATLTAVAVGISSVLSSYYYRFKAGRMAKETVAVDKVEMASASKPVTEVAQDEPEKTTMSKWTREVRVSESPATMTRQ